jgi:hypothetical protein
MLNENEAEALDHLIWYKVTVDVQEHIAENEFWIRDADSAPVRDRKL